MTAVTYSDFWGPAVGAYSLLNNKAPMRNQIKRVMNREQMKVISELANTLLGAAAGGAASMTKARVGHTHSNTEPSTLSVRTDTLINRVTTAADVTALNEILFNVRRAPAYVADRSGNGGRAFTAG